MTSDTTTNIDSQIYDCLDSDSPKSFFLFAGAGSGKTRSLVNVLMRVRRERGLTLKMNRQRVAVITYTNAACNEIKHRLEQDSLFFVSTIHSFVWELIKAYQSDIKVWLINDITLRIAELAEQQKSGRPGTKTAADRAAKIETLTRRLELLPNINVFTYNPNGDNRTKDSLNHSEVINIAASLLSEKRLMQRILTRKYPILLIDESQDTKKELIDAFFAVQAANSQSFSLGLFGDTMQRIYSDGKQNLGVNLPDNWQKPEKTINFRCCKRVLKLINKIRITTDGQQQTAPPDKEEGIVRLFVCSQNTENKIELENNIARRMMDITNDVYWFGDNENIKVLTLEHHMAARRMGFLELFAPLYNSDKLNTGLLDGSLAGMRLFVDQVLPTILAKKANDHFLVAAIVKKHSPLLEVDSLKANKSQIQSLKNANNAVNSLYSLWEKKSPTLLEIIQNLKASGLFHLPDALDIIANRANALQKDEEEESNRQDSTIEAWEQALKCNIDQVEAYARYISGSARFGTHQGVKGLQFERVMVVIDDEEARGFLFSYGKIFGDKELSKTDIDNETAGKETSVDRTTRLFYVACSRAEKSLAIVAYAQNPNAVKQYVLQKGWFEENEIEIM